MNFHQLTGLSCWIPEKPTLLPVKACVMGLLPLFLPSNLKVILKKVTDFLIDSSLLKYLTIKIVTKIFASIVQITKK